MDSRYSSVASSRFQMACAAWMARSSNLVITPPANVPIAVPSVSNPPTEPSAESPISSRPPAASLAESLTCSSAGSKSSSLRAASSAFSLVRSIDSPKSSSLLFPKVLSRWSAAVSIVFRLRAASSAAPDVSSAACWTWSRPVTAPSAAFAIPATASVPAFNPASDVFPSLESPFLKPLSSISVPIFTVPSFGNHYTSLEGARHEVATFACSLRPQTVASHNLSVHFLYGEPFRLHLATHTEFSSGDKTAFALWAHL